MYLIRKEVITMAQGIKKETKEHPEDKKVEIKSGSKSSCGCGCIPLTKKK